MKTTSYSTRTTITYDEILSPKNETVE